MNEQIVYKLKDLKSGLYLKKILRRSNDDTIDIFEYKLDNIDFSRLDNVILTPDFSEGKTFLNINEISLIYSIADRAKKILSNHSGDSLLKKTSFDNLLNIVDKLGNLKIESFRLVDAGLTDTNVLNEINEKRIEKQLRFELSTIIHTQDAEEYIRSSGELFSVFLQWKKLPEKEKWEYILLGGRPDDLYPKKLIKLSELNNLLNDLGINYRSFRDGLVLLKSAEDLNLLNVTYPDAIKSYIKISEVLDLSDKIKSEITSI